MNAIEQRCELRRMVRFSVVGNVDGMVAATEPVTVEQPALRDSIAELHNTLRDGLIAQGLFLTEANAMLRTWNDSWFEEGSRLIYIVPRPVVDEMLPLHIDPAPVEIARVFVGRIELVTPETQRTVESAARGLGRSQSLRQILAADFAARVSGKRYQDSGSGISGRKVS